MGQNIIYKNGYFLNNDSKIIINFVFSWGYPVKSLDGAGVFVLYHFHTEHLPTDIFKEKEKRKKEKERSYVRLTIACKTRSNGINR